jgi:hypothetical protein
VRGGGGDFAPFERQAAAVPAQERQFVVARARPTVRTNKPILSFNAAKTRSTRERIFNFRPSARRIASSVGRPPRFLAEDPAVKLLLAKSASLAAER